jgi:transcription-repair coupling factor (superfamily II helicase)
MEMYKKISYIRNAADVSDVTDELCDRYGEPPKPVLRLLHVAAVRALASSARIAKVDGKEGLLRFFAETPDLATWSVLFENEKHLRFVATVGGPTIVYRLGNGEEGIYAAYRLLSAYHEAKNS